MTKSSSPPGTTRTNRVELILSQLENLPTLPAVAVRLVELTADWHANAKQIVSLIESDPSLTAKILKLARRADVGLSPRAARTVERAVVMLGFETVRNAVLSIKVFEAFGPDANTQTTGPFDRRDFWKHSLAVGCAARLLAERVTGKADPEEAFVCGLLHDLGKVALDAILPKSYARVIEIARIERSAISTVESRLLGVDHALVGRRLGMRWGLPEFITTTMWLHHHEPDSLPDNVQGREYARLVYLADLMVREHRIGFSGNYVFPQSSRDLAQQMGLNAQTYERILQRLAEDIEQRAEMLGLKRITRNSLYLRALAEANEELGRLNEALTEGNRKLHRRSKYFDVLTNLAEQISRTTELPAVSSACAEALCKALDCPGVAVMAASANSRICAAGYSAGGASGANWHQIDAGDGWAGPDSDSADAGRFRPRPIKMEDPLLSVCEGYLPEGPAWLITLPMPTGWSSWAILIGSREQVQKWQADSAELDALLGSICLAMQQAVAAHRAEELAEALAERARELHESEPQRLRKKSLDMVAEMAAGAGHEMNNPLAIISGRAQLLRPKLTDPDAQQACETIAEQADRCSRIVTELMQFARPDPPKPAALELKASLVPVVQEWLEQNGLAAEQVVLDLPDDLPKAKFDAAHLARIVREVLDNSLQAVQDDPAGLRINCRAEASDESIVLSITDNGPGMRPEVLAKALLPFFSYRTAGRRRGLGLSRAYRMAELNGGDLWLESSPEQGTTVFLRLPLA